MTRAVHAGFETRAKLGLIRPVSISRNITAQRGGTALHHGGDNVPTSGHESCRRIWRSWQRFHMGRRYTPPASGHGWVDIAYTLGVCQHGYVFAGRGSGVRTAANGTNYGNQNFYAVVWIGGARQTPTLKAKQAIAWAVRELRKNGAGDRVLGHNDLRNTACPHPDLTTLARALDQKTISDGPSDEGDDVYAIRFGEKSDYVGRVQVILNVAAPKAGLTVPELTVDGDYGPKTRDRINEMAARGRMPRDGATGMHVLVLDYCRNWLSS